jgi:hypothetical protein
MNRTLAALAGAVLAVLLASPARADVLDEVGGARHPNGVTTPWGTPPTDAELEQTRDQAVSLAYDNVTLGRTKLDAAQVKEFWTSAAIRNQEFQAAQRAAQRGFWEEAAESFTAAADSAEGATKEVALYYAMITRANTGDQEATLRAADTLLAVAPKTYYFYPAQETRARVFAIQGKVAEAKAALQAVLQAPGMNVRDFFNAKYFLVWLTEFTSATTPEQFAAAEKSFRGILDEIGRHAKRDLAAGPREKARLALATCLRGQGKGADAKQIFQQVVDAAVEGTDPRVLVGAYNGLADAAFEEAVKLQQGGGARDAVKSALDTASLHYLRVLLLYGDYADTRERYGALSGAARVFASLFTLTEDKDCELGRRSYEFFRQAHELQEAGEEKRALYREGKDIKDRLDAACR